MTNKLKHMLFLYSACIMTLSTACKQKASSSGHLNSELLQKIDAVHQQMQIQGNINEEERNAIKSLASLVSLDGLKSSQDTSNNNTFLFNEVENVPIYPGCEDLNPEDTKQCFIDNVTQFITTEFDTNIAKNLKLSGVQEIEIFFKINEKGYVSNIKVRDTYLELQAEAVRVLNKIPRMIPASKNGTSVGVDYPDYEIPHTIIFEIEE